MQVLKMSDEDILVWADGTWCYRETLHEMSHMSDDYVTLPADSAEWLAHDKE